MQELVANAKTDDRRQVGDRPCREPGLEYVPAAEPWCAAKAHHQRRLEQDGRDQLLHQACVHREIDLEADLRAAKGKKDCVRSARSADEMQSIKDSYKRMSIWPLIEAGEFSAISNGQVTAEDLALADGKWTNWVERKLAKLPRDSDRGTLCPGDQGHGLVPGAVTVSAVR